MNWAILGFYFLVFSIWFQFIQRIEHKSWNNKTPAQRFFITLLCLKVKKNPDFFLQKISTTKNKLMITFTVSAQILYFSATCDFSRNKILNKMDFIWVTTEQILNLLYGQARQASLNEMNNFECICDINV